MKSVAATSLILTMVDLRKLSQSKDTGNIAQGNDSDNLLSGLRRRRLNRPIP